MGKRKRYRFPQGINGIDSFFYPNLHPHAQTSPNEFGGTRYFDLADDGSNMYAGTDPFGQYTGVTYDGSMPIQDADDL